MGTPNWRNSARQLASSARWSFAIAWRTAPRLVLGLATTTLSRGMVPAGLALVIRSLIDGAAAGAFEPLIPWLVVGLALAVTEAVARLAHAMLVGRLTDELNLAINTRILSHAGELDAEFFESPHHQDMVHRARQNIADHVSRFLIDVFAVATNGLQILSLSLIVTMIEPLVLPLLVPFALGHLGFQWRASRRFYGTEFQRATQRRWTEYLVTLGTDRQSVSEVKLLGLYPLLLDRFQELMRHFNQQNRRRYQQRFAGASISASLTAIVVYLLFARVLQQVIAGVLTLGDIAVFGAAILRLRVALEATVSATTSAYERTLYIGNLRDFLHRQPPSGPAESVSWVGAKGEVEVRGLHFYYPGQSRPTLRGVSLRIAPGETVALVGKNGAGKTTLAKLLAGLYLPSAGRILWDGHAHDETPPEQVRANVAFAFQDFVRFEASAAENIAYGRCAELLEDEARVLERAAELGVDELLTSMPEGARTRVGRRFGGHELSGGQWQQLAIARAWARRAPFLILDEPTSNLDPETELEIFRKMQRVARDTSTLLITHRFSTLKIADRILVMERGRIVESGHHEELVALGGHYAALFRAYRERHAVERGAGANP